MCTAGVIRSSPDVGWVADEGESEERESTLSNTDEENPTRKLNIALRANCKLIHFESLPVPSKRSIEKYSEVSEIRRVLCLSNLNFDSVERLE